MLPTDERFAQVYATYKRILGIQSGVLGGRSYVKSREGKLVMFLLSVWLIRLID
jgi:hypothetical protein